MWALTLWNHDLAVFQWAVVGIAALAAMVYDVDCRRIPNRLTGPVLLAGAVWAVWLGGPVGLLDGLAGMTIMATPCLLLFLLAGGGAGDVKMMAALGMWLGTVNGLITVAAVTLSGLLWGIALALARRRLAGVLMLVRRVTHAPLNLLVGRGRPGRYQDRWAPMPEMGVMPYAVAIFTGVCIAAGGIGLWSA